jgi:hypothetical protein
MKFRPLHDRVVVERIDAEAMTAGGIIIPDTAKEKPSQGKIIGVGPGGRDENGKLIPIDLHCRSAGQEEGRLTPVAASSGACLRRPTRTELSKWLPRTLNFPSTRAIECCAGSTFSPMRCG